MVVVSLFLWFLKPEEKINNIIQAIAIVTLVFITWFYARQTRELVKQEERAIEEEKENRYAEYAERRLQELFRPLIWHLIELVTIYKKAGIPDTIEADKIFSDFVRLHFDKGYMASRTLNKRILKYREELDKAMYELKKTKTHKSLEKWRKEILNKTEEMRDQIMEESRLIVISLKEAYGYLTKEEMQEV
jgi:hypothetical protein